MIRALFWSLFGSVVTTVLIVSLAASMHAFETSPRIRHSTERSLQVLGHRIVVRIDISPVRPVEPATLASLLIDRDSGWLVGDVAGASLSCVVAP